MKIRLFISILLSQFLIGCMLPQGANGCDHSKGKYGVCILFDESGEAIVTDEDSSLEIIGSKTYAISPNQSKLVVSKWYPYKFYSSAENREYRNTRVIFSDDQGHHLTHIESGHWQVFLTYKLSDGIEREASMDFNVTQSLYVPFIMRPN